MQTLAELTGTRAEGGSYRAYVIACAEAGKTPMSMAEWVKAGRPSG